ncbi:hypothetical protein [Halobacterium jilantaiense]|uniref:DUF8173 domain-containing protein n=1 Tax=Halobacterium jilantaiense TaxID=355548 RepID=A0A1I0QCG7_9EURY|nr:hypothetical protein [Halobacterium jilantaiense]SEW24589.1 hypothetical protein SAMN04487945_2472 [Halobacterium jilantaiense]
MSALHRSAASLSVLLAVVPATVAARPAAAAQSTELSPPVQAVLAFVATLFVGGVLLSKAPQFVDQSVDRIRGESAACFVWGVVVLVMFVGVSVLLVLTGFGIVLWVPLAVGFVAVAFVGSAVGYLAVFDGILDSRVQALLVGAVVAGATNLVPVLGSIVGFVVGSLGLGAVVEYSRA